MTTWMQTFTGRKFEPLTPSPDQFDIEDIAHALSMICRFGGHTKRFYSVAEHSIHVSNHCHPDDALAGLLHDAAEAYVGDLIRPIKNQPSMLGYRLAEDQILDMILARERLRLYGLPESVKHADNAVLAAERDHPQIVGGAIAPWAELPPPAPVEFGLYDPFWAKQHFLARYSVLKGKQWGGADTGEIGMTPAEYTAWREHVHGTLRTPGWAAPELRALGEDD